MCNSAILEFFIENIEAEEFNGRRVLEIGSRYVNGSPRPLIERFTSPKEYIGVDIEEGRYVDALVPVERVVDEFGEEQFDVVVSTELLEHVKDWRMAVNNMKAVLKRGGSLYLTTRSRGFPYHGYPWDFWRFETHDLGEVFSDFSIMTLKSDREAPGVFLKARKPLDRSQSRDLSGMEMYSVVLGKHASGIHEMDEMPLPRRLAIRWSGKLLPPSLLDPLRRLTR